MDYINYTKEELIELLQEITLLNKQLLEDREREDKLDFSWSGNLGHWYLHLPSGHVVFNPLKVESLGYSMEELPQKVHYRYFTEKIHPDDYENTMNQMRLNMSGNIPIYECEYRIQTKEGSYKWFYDRGKVTQRDENGNPLFAAGIVFDITEKKEQEMQLISEKNQWETKSKTDALTGLYNRRAIMDVLNRYQEAYTESEFPFSIAIFDIDLFKLVNDEKGHIVGDQVITEVANIILHNIRDIDLAGRYGGEEFIILFPSTTEEKAYLIAERIRKKVEAFVFSEETKITISAGVESYKNQSTSDFIAAADEKLYEAKHLGRNRVIYKKN